MNLHSAVQDAALQLYIVAGDTDPVIDFRLIPESQELLQRLQSDPTEQDLRRRYKIRGRVSEKIELLRKRNRRGDAVFFSVNETDGKGVTKAHVVHARCLVLDLDDAPLPEKWRVEPHLIVETSPGKHHVYWAIEKTKNIAAYEDISKRLADYYNGDRNVCDVSHIFRVATFLHQKGKPFRSRIVHQHPDPTDLEFSRLSLQEFSWLPELDEKSDDTPSPPTDGRLTEKLAAEIFDHLAVDDFGSNEAWFELAASVHDASGGSAAVRDIFLEWCAGDPAYGTEFHEANNLQRWESFRDDKERRKTVGTLFRICKKHGVPDRISLKLLRDRATEFDAFPEADDEFEGLREVMLYDENNFTEMLDFAERQLMEYGAPIYQSGGRMVHPVRLEEGSSDDDIRRKSGAIVTLDVNRLRLLEYLRERVKFQKVGKGDKVFDYPVPQKIADHILARADKWKFPVLKGVIQAPTLRADGTLLSDPGYDERSQLLLETGGVKFPEISESPTKDEALTALAILKEPFRDFPFVCNAKGESPSRSVILSAVLTALVRRSLRSAPMHGTTAPTPGTGKSLLIDVVSLIATGRLCTAMSQGASEEEDEKRLFSLLLQGDPLVMIDNVKRPIEGDALCTILTQATWQSRVLGESRKVEVSTSATFMASGNNLAFKGDMTARAILCRIDAQVEKPETRRFRVDLKTEVPKRRADLVMAGLTILRAYVVAGRPGLDRLKPFGRFEDWSNLVRGALIWLGEPDPLRTRSFIAQDDSEAANLFALLEAMRDNVFGSVTAQQLIEAGEEASDHVLQYAIRAVAPKEDSITLGRYLQKMQSRIVGGLRLDAEYNKSRKIWSYAVGQLDGTG